MVSKIPVSNRRARRQSGNEIIEFALMAVFLVPTFLWMFVTGLNLVRFTQVTQITRDIGNMYMQGVDFSTYDAQQTAQRLANSYGMQLGSSFTGNKYSNSGNGGNVYIILSEIKYIGTTSETSCSAVTPTSKCINSSSYVYIQHIDFGNSALQFNGNTVSSALGGTPTAATIDTQGGITNYLTDPNAKAPNVGSLVQSVYADGQVSYVIEAFFGTPDLGFSALPSGGLYQRIFF